MRRLALLLLVFISATVHGADIDWESASTPASGSGVYLAFNNTPIAARDAQGRLLAAWADNGRPKFGRLENGTWSVTELIRANSGATAAKPTLALLNGQPVVAWSETTGGTTRVVATRSNDGGATWSAPLELASGQFESPVALFAGARGDGSLGITLAWHDITANTVYARAWRGSRWETADWTGAVALTSSGGTGHDVALGGRGGTVYAVWEDARGGSNKEIWLAKSTDGGLTWSADYRMARSDGGSVRGEDPSIALAVDGTVYLAYQTASRIYLTQSTDGGIRFSTPRQLGSGLFAHLAANAYGAVAVSWESFSGNLLDDSIKHYGLALSLDALANLDSPYALPGSDTTTSAVQGAVALSDDRVDALWIDTSESGIRKLKHRSGRINVAQFAATVDGALASQSVTAKWKIAAADVGQRGSRYLAANLGNNWWLHDGTTWRAWTGGNLPAHATGTLADANFVVAERADFRALAGTALYVGYRRDGGNLVYRLVYSLR